MCCTRVRDGCCVQLLTIPAVCVLEQEMHALYNTVPVVMLIAIYRKPCRTVSVAVQGFRSEQNPFMEALAHRITCTMVFS